MKASPKSLFACAVAAMLAQSAVAVVQPAADWPAHALGTGSMLPTIRKGDVFWVRALPFSQVQPGMPIVFQRGDLLVCHRVLRIKRAANGETYLVTKGDNNARRGAGGVTARDYLGVAELPRDVALRWSRRRM